MPTKTRTYKSWDDKTRTKSDLRDLRHNRPTHTLERKVRKVGIQYLKSGRHPQQWERQPVFPVRVLTGALAKLGPAGPLGDDLIFECRLHPSYRTVTDLDLEGLSLINLATLFVDEVIEPMLEWALKYIGKPSDMAGKAPDKTGKLRHALYASLQDDPSEIGNFPFKMVSNTFELYSTNPENPNYPAPVNEMPTPNLSHSKDPKAVHHFYNFLVMNGRDMAMKLYDTKFIPELIKILQPFGNAAFGWKGSKSIGKKFAKSLFIWKRK